MKIIKDGKIYVQRKDLVEIFKYSCNLNEIPLRIINRCILEKNIITKQNKNDYIVFDNEDEIEFLSSLNLIIDYQDIKRLSIDELKEGIKYNQQGMKELKDDYPIDYTFLKYQNSQVKDYLNDKINNKGNSICKVKKYYIQ